MTINEKMTALADEIRELSGSNTAKGLDDMTSDVDAANAEIAEQTELLEQIATALEGKAAGGSGEDVTDETNAYTTKLASLETAVAALETELEGKASGGSGGNGNVDICTVTIDNEIYGHNWKLFYSCLIDGKVELVATDLGFESKILENVIKNSYITVRIESYDGSISSSTFSGGVSVVETFAPYGGAYAGECMSVWQVTSDGTVVIGS